MSLFFSAVAHQRVAPAAPLRSAAVARQPGRGREQASSRNTLAVVSSLSAHRKERPWSAAAVRSTGGMFARVRFRAREVSHSCLAGAVSSWSLERRVYIRQNSHFHPSIIAQCSISFQNCQHGHISSSSLFLGSIPSRNYKNGHFSPKNLLLGSLSFLNY